MYCLGRRNLYIYLYVDCNIENSDLNDKFMINTLELCLYGHSGNIFSPAELHKLSYSLSQYLPEELDGVRVPRIRQEHLSHFFALFGKEYLFSYFVILAGQGCERRKGVQDILRYWDAAKFDSIVSENLILFFHLSEHLSNTSSYHDFHNCSHNYLKFPAIAANGRENFFEQILHS